MVKGCFNCGYNGSGNIACLNCVRNGYRNWVPKTPENKMDTSCKNCGNRDSTLCCTCYASVNPDNARKNFKPKTTELKTATQAELQKGVNPKDAIGAAKNPHGCISRAVLAELGLAMMEGSRKYGRHNYRVSPVRAEVYFDACNRHLDAWWEGEDIDSDSGLPHLTKAIACLVVIRDAIIQDSWYDDRPPKTPTGHREDVKKWVAGILEKYPESKPPYIENNHGRIDPPRHFCRECI